MLDVLMSDAPQITRTLATKIADVERWIAETEARLLNARQDLAHLQATLQLFKRGEDMPHPVYMGLSRIFRRGEITSLGLEALKAAPEGLDTRELAVAVMRAKGLDVDERVFRLSLTQSVVTLFGRLERKRVVRCVGTRKGVKVWTITPKKQVLLQGGPRGELQDLETDKTKDAARENDGKTKTC